MSSDEMTLCRNCQRQVHFHCKPINHVQQFLCSVLTVGIWLPVWLAMTFCRTRYCDHCDEPIWRD